MTTTLNNTNLDEGDEDIILQNVSVNISLDGDADRQGNLSHEFNVDDNYLSFNNTECKIEESHDIEFKLEPLSNDGYDNELNEINVTIEPKIEYDIINEVPSSTDAPSESNNLPSNTLTSLNSTFLYTNIANLVFESNISNPSQWTLELTNLFHILRESLLCVVCHSLLVNPYVPDCSESSCKHYICKICFDKKQITNCSICHVTCNFIEDKALSALIECYSQLCSYIKRSSKLFTYLNEYAGDTELIDIISEGEWHKSNQDYEGKDLVEQDQSCELSSQDIIDASQIESHDGNSNSTIASHNSPHLSNENSTSPEHQFEPQPLYSVLMKGEGKITIKRKPPTSEESVTQMSNRLRSSKSNVKPSGCRCGLATAAPGKLTCCGQRCLCYTEQKPCIDCKCRGCRNPHTAVGKKKLRGLEEYRLSLRIEDPTPVEESDTIVKVVGINNSDNLIRLSDPTSPPEEPS